MNLVTPRMASIATAAAIAMFATAGSAQTAADLPPNAKPGECYARVFVPPEYTNASEQVVKRAASERVEIIPAAYEWTEQRVLVKEGSSRLVAVPATYENVSETVEVESGRTIWRLGKSHKSQLADDAYVKAAAALGLTLDSAQPGQCFVERIVAARYETSQEQVVKSESSSRVEIVPAQYAWGEEQVLVKEASNRMVGVPAVYETQTEKLLVKPAHQVWKKGRGLIEKVNNGTGEIMCLVEIPAEYKTVSKRVQVQAATTKKIEIPAEYKTVKVRKLTAAAAEKRVEIPAQYQTITKRSQVSDARRLWAPAGAGADGKATGHQLCLAEIPARSKTVTRRVERSKASTKQVEIPAEYKTVKVRKLVTPAQERRIDIPAEYQTVSKRTLVKDGVLTWQAVLCHTNATPGLVGRIQTALKAAGHDPGNVDGALGRDTLTAVRSFQQAKGLPTGGVTVATLEALGVSAK